MDKLDKIFEKQKELDNEIIKLREISDISRDEWIQKEILAIISELNEVMSEINWKWWKNKFEVNEDKLKEEIIDVLHFFMSLCIKAGFKDGEEIFEKYMSKHKENLNRQHGLSSKKGYDINEK